MASLLEDTAAAGRARGGPGAGSTEKMIPKGGAAGQREPPGLALTSPRRRLTLMVIIRYKLGGGNGV